MMEMAHFVSSKQSVPDGQHGIHINIQYADIVTVLVIVITKI